MSRRVNAATPLPWEAPAAEAFLHSALGEEHLRDAKISPLTEGLSNHNALIVSGESAWVLRINSDESSAFCQRSFEAGNWQLAADAGLAPPLLAQSPDGRCYLSPKLEHGDWPEKYAEIPAGCFHKLFSAPRQKLTAEEPVRLEADVRLLLNLLLSLKQLPLPSNHKGFAGQWQDYQRALGKGKPLWQHCPQWAAAEQRLAECAEAVDVALKRVEGMNVSPQYSHRDLTPHNLLCHHGKLYCIDFEYACASHPLWDLAAVLASHQLSDPSRLALAQAYLKAHPELSLSQLPQVADAVTLHWYFGAIWALLMAGESRDQSYLSWFNRYLQLAIG